MRVEHIGKSTVKITVSRRELMQAGISSERLSPSDPACSALINELTGKLFPEYSPEEALQRISAEVFPLHGEGCIFYLSPTAKKPPKLLKYIITVHSVKALHSICRILSELDTSLQSSAVMGQCCCLRLIAELPERSLSPLLAIEQYGTVTPYGADEAAYLSEHDRMLIPSGAVETVNRLFSHADSGSGHIGSLEKI